MLEDTILNDYKEAMKAKDTLQSSVLSFLRAEMKNTAFAKNKDRLEDNEVVAVVKKQIKQRQDSIEQFTKGGRVDLADKEAKELSLLKKYLPPEMKEEDLQALVREVITATGALGPRDMGKVMKEVNLRVQGQADGRTVSEMVKQMLSGAA